MRNVKLSVLVPVYNKKEYLMECINSIISQKTNFEINIIITDDCSTDGSLELAHDFKSRYPDKIFVLPSEKNQGLLSNIIKAYECLIKNPSPYFCCLDADDYLTDMNFYQKAIDFLDKAGDFNIYASNTTYLNEKQEEVPNNAFFKESFFISTFDDMLNQKAILGNTISSVFRNCVISKDFIEKLRIHIGNHYSEHSVRDDDFRNRIHLENSKAYYVNEVVGFYRVTQIGLYQGSNKLKQVLLKIQSYIDMYYFFDKKYYKFIELALGQLKRINNETLKYDMNNILNYPFTEIIQLCSILFTLSEFNSELVKENIFEIKNKSDKSKCKRNIFSKIFRKK